MDRKRAGAIWGIVLLVLGATLLLQNLGVLGAAGEVLWFAMAAAGGAGFGWLYMSDRRQWWAVIPASALLGLALIAGLSLIWPDLPERFTGTVFLAFLAIGFLTVYAVRRDNWWALIPGGVLVTTAVVAALGDTVPSTASGAVMMLGIAATFGLLSRIETPQGRLAWALIPAGILTGVALILVLQGADWAGVALAALLIAAGAVIILLGYRRPPG